MSLNPSFAPKPTRPLATLGRELVRRSDAIWSVVCVVLGLVLGYLLRG